MLYGADIAVCSETNTAQRNRVWAEYQFLSYKLVGTQPVGFKRSTFAPQATLRSHRAYEYRTLGLCPWPVCRKLRITQIERNMWQYESRQNYNKTVA